MAKTEIEPKRPKRYLSAYMLFLGEFRKANRHKGYNNSEMMSTGAAIWRQLLSSDRQPYEELSLIQKNIYTKALQQYKEMKRALLLKEKKAERRKARESGRPKKPLSAYMLFLKDYRKENAEKGWGVTDTVCRGAQVWNDLSDHQISPYNSKAWRCGVAFEKKLEAYEQKQERAKTKTSDKAIIARPRKTKTPSRASKTKRRKSHCGRSRSVRVESSRARRRDKESRHRR